MRPIREAAGQELLWSGKDESALRSGDEVVAIVHAREKGRDWTIAEAADGRWAVRTRNIGSGAMVVITEPDSQAQIAVVKRGHKRGFFARGDAYIEFPDGRTLMWHNASKRRDEWEWVDGDARPLIHFEPGGRVVIEPLAHAIPELSLLAIVGWQLLEVQEEERKRVAVAAFTAAAGSTVVVSHK